jgi:hypothetical protein
MAWMQDAGSESDAGGAAAGGGTPSSYSSFLPTPEFSNLEELSQRIGQATLAAKDHIATCLLKDGYLAKLFELFHSAEAAQPQRTDALHALFGIFKGVFLLNDCTVLEQVLNEENILSVIACLEYDPDLPPGTSHTRHRDFMTKSVRRRSLRGSVSATLSQLTTSTFLLG